MCGFAGIYYHPTHAADPGLRERLAAMVATIAHRGPDDESFLVTPFGGAGFRRLSILDLQGGGQPVRNGDGTVEVFFNGEIYNHRDLREQLRREHGVDVRTGSDAAVLPHLYERYGPDFVQLCNGMFAICVVDHRTRTVRLWRDRLGIKPLYFAAVDGAVVFGSELKPILHSGLVPFAVDDAQLVPFLELFYVPGPSTLARGIEKLLPGECLELAPDRPPRRLRWWSLATPRPVRADDGLEELDALLADATRLQLMADVPIGISLSGGLDSGLIAHWAHAHDASVRAYTIAFPDTDPGELVGARATSHALGIEHVELSPPPGDFLAELDQTTWFNDEPVADPAFYPALMVARAAAQHVKVLLSGSGADELFGGYGHHTLTSRHRGYRLLALALGDHAAAALTGLHLPPAERAALRGYGRDRLPWHARAMTHLTPADRAALHPLVRRDHLAELGAAFAAAGWMDARNRQLFADATTYLPHQLLSLLDRTTMAASIEGRVPFLDHRVAEFAMTIHGRHKYGNARQNKLLLRRLAARHLPATVAHRPKTGFPNSTHRWLSRDRLPAIRDRLLARQGYVAGVFPADWLRALLASPEQLDANVLTVHSLLVLQAWHQQCQRTPPAPVPLGGAGIGARR